jgi:putative oxidoreductase
MPHSHEYRADPVFFLLECRLTPKISPLKESFMTRLNALQPLGLLLLRLALGIIFISYGYPTLANPGWMHNTYSHQGLWGYFVVIFHVLEVFAGALLILGLFTRVAALLMTVEMAVAIWPSVHIGGGLKAVHNYEFPLALLAGCFALATVGAGRASIDYALYEGSGRSRGPKSKPK